MDMFYINNEEGNRVELPRPETKTLEDVKQCIYHHKGDDDSTVKLFINMYLLGIQWDWFEEYKQYLKDKTEVISWNTNRLPDEEGNLSEPHPLPVQPPRPNQLKSINDVMLELYTDLRQAAYGNYQTQFDIAYKSYSSWEDYIEEIRLRYPSK